jgi:hypothetical protein
MAVLNKQDLIDALTQLGQLAELQRDAIELVLVGGGLMVLLFETRQATRDLDVVILAPTDVSRVRRLATLIAEGRGWPNDWLNDAVKGFMPDISNGPIVFSAPGIVVRRPAIQQLLAMKLCAWRDDVDIADATRLLQELPGAYDDVWHEIVPFLQSGQELKGQVRL